MTNYTKLKKFSPFFYSYVFLDTDKHMGSEMFQRYKMKVRFHSVYVKENNPYRYVFCKIKKKDEERFIKALGELEKNAMILQYEEYPKYCEIFEQCKVA